MIFASAQHTNADNVIKRRIGRISDPGNWTLVSSDHEILNFARSHRMKLMSSAQFSQELGRAVAVEETRGEEVNPAVTQTEIDELLDAFGGQKEP